MGKGGRESARPSYGRPKLTLISREKNHLRRCSKKLSFLTYIKIFSQEDFALKSKLWPLGFLLHRLSWFFFSQNKGQLRTAVTRPCRLPTLLCHTYSEPSGHEDSPGGTQNIPYLFKNLSKSRLSDPFFGLFLVISEVGSQIYITNLAIFKIWVFSATFWHEITLYAIDIDKKWFRTPFLAL